MDSATTEAIQPWIFEAFPPGDKHGRIAQECIGLREEILHMLQELKFDAEANSSTGQHKEYRELECDMKDLDSFARSGISTREQMEQMDSSCTMLHLRVSSQLAKVKSCPEGGQGLLAEVDAVKVIEEQARLLGSHGDTSKSLTNSNAHNVTIAHLKSDLGVTSTILESQHTLVELGGNEDQIFRPQIVRMSQYRTTRLGGHIDRLGSRGNGGQRYRLRQIPAPRETHHELLPNPLSNTLFSKGAEYNTTPRGRHSLAVTTDFLSNSSTLQRSHIHEGNSAFGNVLIADDTQRSRSEGRGSQVPEAQKADPSMQRVSLPQQIQGELFRLQPSSKDLKDLTKSRPSGYRKRRRSEPNDGLVQVVKLHSEEVVMSGGYGPAGTLAGDGGKESLLMRNLEFFGDSASDMSG